MREADKASLWFIASLIFSLGNDTITKLLQESLSPSKLVLFRFFFSSILLLPLVFSLGFKSIKTSHIFLHLVRGAILALALVLWSNAIGLVPIATVTLMSFTIPVFTSLLAVIFLKEKITKASLIAIILGFIGSIITITGQKITFNLTASFFLIASILFATLDIINKKLLNLGEKSFPLLFYSNIFSFFFLFLIEDLSFKAIDHASLFLTFTLALGANLILFAIIKAFSYAKASTLAPLRYLELVLSSLVGYFFFEEAISSSMIIGGALVIISSLIITLRNGGK
jgi:S-adenosylmethionine uptake transporter